MIEAKRYLQTVLNTDLSQDMLFVATEASAPTNEGSDVACSVSLVRKRPLPGVALEIIAIEAPIRPDPEKRTIDVQEGRHDSTGLGAQVRFPRDRFGAVLRAVGRRGSRRARGDGSGCAGQATPLGSP